VSGGAVDQSHAAAADKLAQSIVLADDQLTATERAGFGLASRLPGTSTSTGRGTVGGAAASAATAERADRERHVAERARHLGHGSILADAEVRGPAANVQQPVSAVPPSASSNPPSD
jgi:hypothetical protein